MRSPIAFTVLMVTLATPAPTWGMQHQSVARRHAVGFRVDSTSAASDARTDRVLLWYPAAHVTSAPMRFEGYARADRPELSADSALAEAVRGYGIERTSMAARRALARSATAAHANALRATGGFPVVLLGNGLTSAGYVNATLAESLAARGHVVASLARSHRTLGFTVAGVEAIASAMRRAVPVASAVGGDTTRIALVGWSVGAVAQALLQMQDARVRAIVSLDGGIGYDYARPLIDSSTWSAPAAAVVPVLQLTGFTPSGSPVQRDAYYVDSIARGTLIVATFPALAHANFTSFGVRVRQLAGDSAARTIAASYADVVRLVGAFLDVALAETTAAPRIAPWARAASGETFTIGVRRVRR